MQRQTYEQVLAAGRPVRASDLMSVLKAETGTLTPTVVYRALEVLVANGYLHKIKSLNSFVPCKYPDQPHEGQFLICERCGQVIELHSDQLAADLEQLSAAQGFKTQSQVIELFGQCKDCQTKIPAS